MVEGGFFYHGQVMMSKMTDLLCKMTNRTLKITSFLAILNVTSLRHLTFHVVLNKILRASEVKGLARLGRYPNQCECRKPGLGVGSSQPHCLEAISALFRSNLRFITQFARILYLSRSLLVSHIELVILCCLG